MPTKEQTERKGDFMATARRGSGTSWVEIAKAQLL